MVPMSQSDRLLQRALTFQGLFYLAVNLWALVATQHFLSYSNPAADFFEARSFAAISIVTAIFFLVGAWRQDLLRPAAFLGLGMAVAMTLVEIFHLPALGWRTILWFDLVLEIILAGLYIFLFFFRREEAPAKADASVPPPEVAAALPADEPVTATETSPPTIAEELEPMIQEEELSPDSHVV